MQHPFTVLQPEYDSLLATMRVTRPLQVNEAARQLLRVIDLYKREEEMTGVPAAFLAAVDQREDDNNPLCAIGQGDQWDRRSTTVPRGKGPWSSKLDADVFYINYAHLNDGEAPWSWPYACWKGEGWNGFGYRSHGVATPYLWAGTNHYSRGKYVADGQWDANALDQQLGIIPVMRRLVVLDPSLAFKVAPPPFDHVTKPPTVQLPPEGLGAVALHDVRWVQQALNECYLPNADALRVDGSYGRYTQAAVRSFQRFNKLMVDGLYGPQTDKALTAALEQHRQGVAVNRIANVADEIIRKLDS